MNWRRWLAATLLLAGCQAPPGPGASATPGRPTAAFPPALTAELEGLREAALRSDYAYGLVQKLCALGPRMAGSVQAQKAVDLVAGELELLGLRVTREKVMVPHWVRGRESAEIVGSQEKLALTTLGGSGATPAQGLIAPVAVVHSFEELESVAVQGKIVFFDVAFDEAMAAEGQALQAYAQAVPFRSQGPARAARKGAVATLVRSIGSGRLPHTGETEFAEGQTPIPAAALSVPAAERLAALSQKGSVRLRLILTPQNLPPVESCNLVADIPGSQHPEEVVIVSAHLDSWDLGTGAADNAAGVAMALQTANLLRELKLKPVRTLRVVAWMSEEYTQAGAQAYAEAHRGELPQHVAAIENDLGCAPPIRIDGQVDEAALQRLAPLKNLLASVGVGRLRASRGTRIDLIPLAQAGVPCYSPIQDPTNLFDYHHTTDDILARVEPANLQKNCAVTAALAYTLTQLP